MTDMTKIEALIDAYTTALISKVQVYETSRMREAKRNADNSRAALLAAIESMGDADAWRDIYDRVMSKLAPAIEHVQANSEKFGAQAGSNALDVINREFMRLAAIESRGVAESVPLYFTRIKGWGPWNEGTERQYNEVKAMTDIIECRVLYTAPPAHTAARVSDELDALLADREALEGVAEWLKHEELQINVGLAGGDDRDVLIESSAGWLLRLVSTAMKESK